MFTPPVLWIIAVVLTLTWVGFVLLINARIREADAGLSDGES